MRMDSRRRARLGRVSVEIYDNDSDDALQNSMYYSRIEFRSALTHGQSPGRIGR